MLDLVRMLAEELNEGFVQPHIHRIKVEFRLKLATAAVIALFALLGMICLFLFVFLTIAQATSGQEAALILFAFCVFICLGAVLFHALGKAYEERKFERRFLEREKLDIPMPRMPDLHLGRRAHDAFADHKIGALVTVAVLGMLFGSRPGPAMRTASKLVLGRRKPKYEEDWRGRFRRR